MNAKMKGKKGAERRRFHRYDLHMPLVLSDDTDQLLDRAPLMRDISLGGFGFITSSPIKSGVSFRFHLEFPKRKKVSGIAKTCWVKSHRDVMFASCGAQIISLRWGHKGILSSHLGA